jgi:hypothetical protein
VTLRAGVYNFVIYQGADFDTTLTWKNSDGSAVNLTGYTARLHVRETVESLTTLLEMTTGNGSIVLGGVAGTIRLLLTSTATAALTWSQPYPFDLELVSGGGIVTRLLEGTFELDKEVTR